MTKLEDGRRAKISRWDVRKRDLADRIEAWK